MTPVPLIEYQLRIEEGKIREFTAAVQSNHPAHEGPDAVIPPTFLTTALHFSGHDSAITDALGFDLSRTFHGEEEYEFTGELPRAGDVLTAATRVDLRWERTGQRGGVMRFARLVTEYRNAGSLVATQCTTMLEVASAE